MSGGHLDYHEFYIQDMIDSLHYDKDKCLEAIRKHGGDGEAGFEDYNHFLHLSLQEKHDIVQWLSSTIRRMDGLYESLHKYDYAMSGDTCLEDFVEHIKK